ADNGLQGVGATRRLLNFLCPESRGGKRGWGGDSDYKFNEVYWGKHFPNASSSLSGPSSLIFRRRSAHTTFFSFLRKPIHVCESAVTCRSDWPTCPFATLIFWSLITTVACRCSWPVKVKWKVAFNPADLPGWKTRGIPFRKTSMVFGRRLLSTCLIFLWGNRLAT